MERTFKSLRLPLGAYQTFAAEAVDLGEQFTKSGDEPRTLKVTITTAMDELFVNRSILVLLTEEAQRDLIQVLQANLLGERFLLEARFAELKYSELIV